MSLSIQKAGLWKRISAWLFDFILVITLTVGGAALFSGAIGYDANYAKLQTYYEQYETEYGVDFDISEEEYNGLSEEELAKFKEASEAYSNDENVKELNETIVSQTLLIIGVSLFVAYLIWYFLIPLAFHDGRTLGKKIFGLAVMRTNCVAATKPVLFIRAIIGQYAIETMFPVLLFLMIYFGMMGIVGTITIGLLLLLQIGVLCATKTNSAIHDLLTDTVVVDYASQQIFDTEEELLAYKQEQQRQEVAKAEYV